MKKSNFLLSPHNADVLKSLRYQMDEVKRDTKKYVNIPVHIFLHLLHGCWCGLSPSVIQGHKHCSSVAEAIESGCVEVSLISDLNPSHSGLRNTNVVACRCSRLLEHKRNMNQCNYLLLQYGCFKSKHPRFSHDVDSISLHHFRLLILKGKLLLFWYCVTTNSSNTPIL